MAQKRVRVRLTGLSGPSKPAPNAKQPRRRASKKRRPAKPRAVVTTVTPAMQRYLTRPLHDLGLSLKTVSALENDENVPDSQGRVWHIRTIAQLLHATPAQLLAVTNLGACTLREIYTRLSAVGFVKPGFEKTGKDLAAAEHRRAAAARQLRKRLGYLADVAPPTQH